MRALAFFVGIIVRSAIPQFQRIPLFRKNLEMSARDFNSV